MANKYDLETKVVPDTDAAAACWTTNIGDAVPAGKTRFLTYLRVARKADITMGIAGLLSQIEVAVACYSTNASTVTSYTTMLADAKVLVRLPLMSMTTAVGTVDADLVQEVKGSIDEPILTVAASNFMMLGAASGATATILAQYYDE